MQEIDSIASCVERVVQSAGRFRLVQAAEGFAWTFADKAGTCWYWNTRERQWTGRPQPRPTAAEATAGFSPAAPPDPA